LLIASKPGKTSPALPTITTLVLSAKKYLLAAFLISSAVTALMFLMFSL
jgi:hypothetical protein